MEVKLYTIRDTVAGECGPVFTAKNDGVAVRQACLLLHEPSLDVSDYALYCIGTFDVESMEFKDKTPHEIDIIIPYKAFQEKMETVNAVNTFIKEVK